MKDYIKQIADGRLTRGEVIERLKGWSKDSVKDFLDDMVATAIVILMDGGNTPANQVKSNRLSDMVDSIATELLPGYDKLRKPTQTASGRNQRNTDTGNEFRSCLLIQDDKKDENDDDAAAVSATEWSVITTHCAFLLWLSYIAYYV